MQMLMLMLLIVDADAAGDRIGRTRTSAQIWWMRYASECNGLYRAVEYSELLVYSVLVYRHYGQRHS